MIDIVRTKCTEECNAGGTLLPAEGDLSRALLEASFVRVLEDKLREAAFNRCCNDIDNFNMTTERGGFKVDASGQAADGVAESGVEDVVRALLETGFRVGSDDIDAMLNQYLRTGLVTDVVLTASLANGSRIAVPLAIDAAIPPLAKEECVDGYRVIERSPGMWHVSPSGNSMFSSVHLAIALPSVTHCSCGLSTCERLSAVLKHLASTVPVSGRACEFERTAKGERLNRALRLAGSYGIFAPSPKRVRKGRPEIPVTARAFALILKHMLGQEYDDEGSVNVRALLKAGVYKTRLPHVNTRRRYSKDASVLRLLSMMRTVVARPLVERHLLHDHAFGGEARNARDLAAEIVSCLDTTMDIQLRSQTQTL